MKKLFKFVLFLIIALIIIVAAGAVALNYFVDPNRFKPQIIKQVADKTGRMLKLTGDLRWSLFPTVGFEINQAQLGNPKGFKADSPFVQVKTAKISVKLLPLLRGKIETNELMVSGLTVYLIKDKSGRMNWQMAAPEKAADFTTQQKDKDYKQAADLSISSIRINDAAVTCENQQTGQRMSVRNINAKISNLGEKRFFPVEISSVVQNSKPQVEGNVTLSGQVYYDLASQLFQVKKLRFGLDLTGSALPDGKLKASLSQDSVWTVSSNEIKMPAFKLKVNGGDITGDVDIQNMKTLAGSANLKLQNLRVKGSTINGTFDLRDLAKRQGQFNFDIDQLDTSQWSSDVKTTQAAAGANRKKVGRQRSAALSDDVIRFLKSLDLQGSLRLGVMKASNIKMNNIQAKCRMSRGIAIISPMTAQFYRGRLNSTVHVIADRSIPVVQVKGTLSNVDLQPLIAAFSRYANFSGTADINANLETRGLNAAAMTRALSGTTALNVQNGVLKGVDIPYIIRVGRALLKKESLPKQEGPNQTDFGRLTASIHFKNGVGKNDDLQLVSNEMTAEGEGTINLVNKTLDYKLRARAVQDKDFIAPIFIQGSFDDLKMGIDQVELFKNIVKKQIEKRKDILEEKLKSIKIPDLFKK